MTEFTVRSLADWNVLAARLLEYAGARRKFFLYGEMGAGKTTLVQALCRRLGTRQGAVSPSFALVNEYPLADSASIARHLDLFRLRDLQEALDIGVEDYLYDDTFSFFEWPELLEPLAPEDTLRIQIEQEGEGVRKVLYL